MDYIKFKNQNELYHHGIIGQRWGVRRFQNPDGSLTPRGERRLARQEMKIAAREAKAKTASEKYNAKTKYLKAKNEAKARQMQLKNEERAIKAEQKREAGKQRTRRFLIGAAATVGIGALIYKYKRHQSDIELEEAKIDAQSRLEEGRKNLAMLMAKNQHEENMVELNTNKKTAIMDRKLDKLNAKNLHKENMADKNLDLTNVNNRHKETMADKKLDLTKVNNRHAETMADKNLDLTKVNNRHKETMADKKFDLTNANNRHAETMADKKLDLTNANNMSRENMLKTKTDASLAKKVSTNNMKEARAKADVEIAKANATAGPKVDKSVRISNGSTYTKSLFGNKTEIDNSYYNKTNSDNYYKNNSDNYYKNNSDNYTKRDSDNYTSKQSGSKSNGSSSSDNGGGGLVSKIFGNKDMVSNDTSSLKTPKPVKEVKETKEPKSTVSKVKTPKPVKEVKETKEPKSTVSKIKTPKPVKEIKGAKETKSLLSTDYKNVPIYTEQNQQRANNGKGILASLLGGGTGNNTWSGGSNTRSISATKRKVHGLKHKSRLRHAAMLGGTMDYLSYRYLFNDELYHYGIPGQKWGVRRFENPDGTLTDAGKARYNTNKEYKKSIDMSDEDLRRSTSRLRAERDYERAQEDSYEKRIPNTARKALIVGGASAVLTFGATLLTNYITGSKDKDGKRTAGVLGSTGKEAAGKAALIGLLTGVAAGAATASKDVRVANTNVDLNKKKN